MRNLNTFCSLYILSLLFNPWSIEAQVSQNMSLLYQYDDPNVTAYSDVWGYSDNGTEVAIIGTRDSILFFDVTNPSQVVKLPSVAPGGSSSWRDFKTYENYCYGVTDVQTSNEGLTIINMDSLLEGKLTFKVDSSKFEQAHNIFIDSAKGKLYAVGADPASGARHGLIIYNLEPDPYNPQLLASFNFNDILNICGGSSNTYVHDLHVRNDTAYCNMGSNCGYMIFDVSNPSVPFWLGDMPSSGFQSGYNHSNWITEDGNYAAVAEETSGNPVHFADISDPWSISVVSTYKDPLDQNQSGVIAHNPFIKGNLCFISYYHDGVIVLDISDITNPARVAYYDTEPNNTDYNGFEGAWGVYPYLPSGNVLASDMNNGLFVLEVDQSVLAIEWMNFEVVQENTKTFSIQAEFQSTQNLEKAELYWSSSGEHFSLLAPLNTEEEKLNTYKVNETFKRPSPNTFYVQIRTTESDGYQSESVVRRVNAASNNSFTIFPNPSDDEIYVEHGEAKLLELYNANGKLMQEHIVKPGINKIQLKEGITPGIYTAVLRDRTHQILNRAKLLVNP